MRIDHGAMQGLIELLDHTFKDLDVGASLDQIETIAVTVHNAMNVQTRNYHNLEHVFNFTNPNDPIVHIAALYHDIVYYQVDRGFYSGLEPFILPYIVLHNGEFSLIEEDPADDHFYRLLLAIFDYKPGQALNIYSGLNEFLSALVMTKMLENILPGLELVHAMVCIEATIPFRGPDSIGRRHFDVLEERLLNIKPWCGFDCNSEEIENILRRAVLFSNKDVETFAEANVDRFLDITWKLLPEMNSALRSRGIYTVREYRLAIQKMHLFLSGLNSDYIFNEYKGTPTAEVYENMLVKARHNLTIGVKYLQIKLVAMGILEAIAEYSGGDAPISLFIGDIAIVGANSRHLDDFLPETTLPAYIDPENDEIYQLLKIGRHSETFFDLRNSPLSLFVYQSLEPKRMEQIYEATLLLFNNSIHPTDFLDKLPRALRNAIAAGCAIMAYTRREKLLQLINQN